MTRNLSILNLLTVILLIIVNYYSQILELNDNTIGSVSQEYYNLFTPAPYAFSIWGLIFIALLVYSIFQINRAFFSDEDHQFITNSGPWFAIANIACAGWVIAWLYEHVILSVVLMLIILVSLLRIVCKTNMEKWDAPFKIIAFTWWPICLYAGWITVATIANIAALLVKLGYKGMLSTQIIITVVMIIVAVIINLLMVYLRNMREFALVGMWALFAIFIRHQDQYPSIAYTALAGTIIIFIYVGYHGFKNRKSNPMYRMLNP